MIKKGTDILKQHKKSKLTFNADIQQINFLDNRVYKRRDGLYYPSVTTILQYMPKDQFFESWLKDVGHNSNIIIRKAGDEGTQVHEAAEELVLGKEISWMDDYGKAKYSEKVWQMILRFHDFWTTVKPELMYTEEFTYSDIYQYAGTADIVAKIDGEIWLLDIKTSNYLHKSYYLQLSAYVKAFEETKGIKIDHTGIIWLKSAKRSISKKKGVYQGKNWELKIVDDIDKNFELFECIYKFYRIDNPVTEPIYKKYPVHLKI